MKTMLAFFVLFFVCFYPWKKETQITELNNLEAVFLNNPGDFTFLLKNENEIKQKRYDNVSLHICDNCFPHAVITENIGINIFGVKGVNSIIVNLYVPSIGVLEEGQATVGKNRTNRIHKITE